MIHIDVTRAVASLFVGLPAGLLCGGLAACAGYRLPRGISLWGRSVCDACGRKLSFPLFMPVIGFLISNFKCRYCGARIEKLYLLVEVAVGVVSVLLLYLYGPGLAYLKYMVLLTGLAAAWVSDITTRLIPHRLNFLLAVFALPFVVLCERQDPLGAVIGLAMGFAAPFSLGAAGLALTLLTKKDKMPGGGDILTLSMMGMYLGSGNLVAFAFAGISAIIFAAVTREKGIPMGPHFFVGTAAAVLLR